MSFTISNWACLSASLNQGQQTVTPFGGSPTVINSPNIFIYGSPTDTVSTIVTVGYFNGIVTELSTGDWIIGNGSNASFQVYVQSIIDGVVTVADVNTGASGPYLLKSANLSDVLNTENSFSNLGLGKSGILLLTDADFAATGGTYVLSNPPPIIISMSATSTGRVLRLPPCNQSNSLLESESIELLTTENSDPINIENATGALFFQTIGNSSWRAVPNDRTTIDGAWEFLGETQTLNGFLTGNIEITSSNNSIDISALDTNKLDITVSSTSSLTLQNAYDNGDGTLTISQDKPVAFKKNVSDQGAGFLLPSFTTTEINALSNFNNSEMMWDSELDRIAVNADTALDPRLEYLAYLSDVTELDADASYGECYFTSNSTNTTFVSPATPVIIKGTYNSGDLKLFTHSNGVLTYTGTITREFDITAILTASYTGATNNTTFMIAHNGSAISKSLQSTLIGGTTPANQSNPVGCILSLAQNDTVAVWVQNEDSTDSIKIYDINFSVKSIGGASSSASGITLVGEDYLDLTGTVLTANKIALDNMEDLAEQTVIGRDSGTGSPEALTMGSGMGISSGNLFSKVVAGNSSPILIPGTNVSTCIRIGEMLYLTNMSESGGVVTLMLKFSFTATNFDCYVRIPFPVMPGGLTSGQITVTGNIYNAIIPTTSDGVILGITDIRAANFGVSMHVVSSTNYIANVQVMYQLV